MKVERLEDQSLLLRQLFFSYFFFSLLVYILVLSEIEFCCFVHIYGVLNAVYSFLMKKRTVFMLQWNPTGQNHEIVYGTEF